MERLSHSKSSLRGRFHDSSYLLVHQPKIYNLRATRPRSVSLSFLLRLRTVIAALFAAPPQILQVVLPGPDRASVEEPLDVPEKSRSEAPVSQPVELLLRLVYLSAGLAPFGHLRPGSIDPVLPDDLRAESAQCAEEERAALRTSEAGGVFWAPIKDDRIN